MSDELSLGMRLENMFQSRVHSGYIQCSYLLCWIQILHSTDSLVQSIQLHRFHIVQEVQNLMHMCHNSFQPIHVHMFDSLVPSSLVDRWRSHPSGFAGLVHLVVCSWRWDLKEWVQWHPRQITHFLNCLIDQFQSKANCFYYRLHPKDGGR